MQTLVKSPSLMFWQTLIDPANKCRNALGWYLRTSLAGISSGLCRALNSWKAKWLKKLIQRRISTGQIIPQMVKKETIRRMFTVPACQCFLASGCSTQFGSRERSSVWVRCIKQTHSLRSWRDSWPSSCCWSGTSLSQHLCRETPGQRHELLVLAGTWMGQRKGKCYY